MKGRFALNIWWLVPGLSLVILQYATGQSLTPGAQDQTALPGGIRGKITLTKEAVQLKKPMTDVLGDRYGAHGHGESEMTSASMDTPPLPVSECAVVFLEGTELNQRKYPIPLTRPILDQRGLQFRPQVLAVLVGTTVEFPNRDNLYHNVFSYSQPKEFDLGRYPKDDSRSVTFDRPGIVRVYCDIHAHMHATVIVLQHPYFAVPHDDGEYAIPNVPDGTYTLVLWLDRDVIERRTVEVRAGQSVVADFRR